MISSSVSSHMDPVRLSPAATSPLKVSHDAPVDVILSATVQSTPPDGSAPPSLASAPDPKPPREAMEVEIKEPLSLPTVISSVGLEKEFRGHHKGSEPRKGSEPPPSLQALFSRDMGSSRRWADRQYSTGDLGNVHLKQHSFDSSHLKSISPYPKYLHRVKSPSVLDKNTTRLDAAAAAAGGGGGGESEGAKQEGKENLHRTPSHPHLNSPSSSPQVSRSMNLPVVPPESTTQPVTMVRAQSSQQLKTETDNDEKAQKSKLTKSGSGESASEIPQHHLPASTPEVPSGLKLMKDRELSQSKESLDSSKDAPVTPGIKRTSSKESVKVKDKVIQGPTKELASGPTVGVSLRDLNKENRERSAPSKDTQTGAEGSVENMQAPLFQQVRTFCRLCSHMENLIHCRVLPPSI